MGCAHSGATLSKSQPVTVDEVAKIINAWEVFTNGLNSNFIIEEVH